MALDAYLIGWRWSDVGGNVEAQFIIATPGFITLHLLSKRRAERHQAEVHARLDAQDEALTDAHAKVAEIHQQLTD
ncbi:hypothetical protein ABZX95_16995 [Streptomyces sp. NPDC004232]|uniref:hypothetical protein n=1 Tax=Streptomyces sp. NPDC004232 TaxID=3154454 RepID=UPI0033A69837